MTLLMASHLTFIAPTPCLLTIVTPISSTRMLLLSASPALQAAARIVLQDWNEGRIPYYTLPPKARNTQYNTAEVVTTWAAEFDADK
jgi:ribosome biogenesis GTPase A